MVLFGGKEGEKQKKRERESAQQKRRNENAAAASRSVVATTKNTTALPSPPAHTQTARANNNISHSKTHITDTRSTPICRRAHIQQQQSSVLFTNKQQASGDDTRTKNTMADGDDNTNSNKSDLSRVYRAVAAGESAKHVRRAIEEVAQGSDETRALVVNQKGEGDETPLAAAHCLGRGDLVGALVEAGAGIGGVFGSGPLTPIAVCVVYGQAESVSALLKAGYDPNETIPWHPSSGFGADSTKFCTAAHLCVLPQATDFCPGWHGPQVECLKVLLREGRTDVNARDCYGMTPIFWLAWRPLTSSQEEQEEERAMARALVAAGGRALRVFDHDGATPLMATAWQKNTRIARMLIEEAGAPANERSPTDGLTALHLACRKQDATMVALLLGEGADINARSQFGRTPLSECAILCNAEMTRMLLNRGASANVLSTDGHTLCSRLAYEPAGFSTSVGRSSSDFCAGRPSWRGAPFAAATAAAGSTGSRSA
jgi:ankyrin repeat protein